MVRGPRPPVRRHGARSGGHPGARRRPLPRIAVSTALLLVAALLVQLVQLAVPVGLPRPAAAATFASPVPWRGDLPDPHVVAFRGRYYAYGTTTAGANVPVLTGVDLVHWVTGAGPGHPVADALPVPARWAARRPGGGGTEVWAPSVARLAGRWVMHYAVLARADGRHCISVATSSSPLGPFTDTSAGPLVCSGDPMGSIDPTVVTSGGVPFLIWKNEGVPHRAPTRVWSRALTAGGTGFAHGTSAHELLRTGMRWEGDLVEGPSMLFYAHHLYLFYSANAWDSARYATGYAVCRSVLGPCRRVTSAPLLASAPHQLGPGGPSAFLDGAGRLRLAFHAWGGPATSYPRGARTLHVARLSADRYGRLHVVSR
ncbi:MAG: glycoside hydrolase family 43 protein [Motilibacteraceae bacterium]